MIHSFIFSDGKLVGQDLEVEALRLVRGDKGLVLWVDLENPTEEEIKLVLSDVFQFHPLAIEDCVTPSALPKIEDFEDYLFIVTHAVDFTRTEKFNTTELDLFLGKDYLVSFHRTPLKSVSSVFDRCIKTSGVVARGPDRIAHFLLDAMVDNFQPIIDEMRSELEEIEETVLSKESHGLIPDLMHVRADINLLRQIIRPQRELVTRLAHGENKLIRALMLPYFRDLRDNLTRIEETATSFADQLLISFDLYLSKSDYEANQGIKTLTALTVLSLPATLISTWYGMNFEYIPELKSAYGYPIIILITVISTAFTWAWCKRQRWI
jgi:magnesium transporter